MVIMMVMLVMVIMVTLVVSRAIHRLMTSRSTTTMSCLLKFKPGIVTSALWSFTLVLPILQFPGETILFWSFGSIFRSEKSISLTSPFPCPCPYPYHHCSSNCYFCFGCFDSGPEISSTVLFQRMNDSLGQKSLFC